ncbi:MAG: hypothetical protein ABIR17_10530 [Pseudolysinimonas sp.]|uniref:hypothetical protein n=1 Tax=Pseudolysinimonas sp. TaxID=2680009 RepID=UPI00326746B8
MRVRLGLFTLISFVAFLVAFGVASFVVDPENLGLRIGLYVVALVAVIATILLGVFTLVLPLFGRTGVSAAQLGSAVTAGRTAFARVRQARATGARLNNGSAYAVTLVVAATDLPAYTVSDTVRIAQSDGALVGRGEIITVVRLATDRPQVVAIKGPNSTPQDAAVPNDAPVWPGQ